METLKTEEESRMNGDKTVECFEPKSYLWYSLVFALIGGAMVYFPWSGILPAPRKTADVVSPIVVFGVMGGFFGAMALWSAVDVLCSRIVADGQGLRWRKFRVWRSAKWAEVEDFFVVRSGRTGGVIETVHGKISLSSSMVNRVQLATIVQRRACGENQQWGRKGTRLKEGETRTYLVNFRAQQRGLGLTLLLLPFPWVFLATAHKPLISPGMPFWINYGPVLLWLGLMQPYVALPCIVMLPQYCAARKLRGSSVRIDTREIVVSQGSQVFSAQWAQLTEVVFTSDMRVGHLSSCVLRNGMDEIELVHPIFTAKGPALRHVLRQCLLPSTRAIEVDASERRPAPRPDSTRRFTYRNSTARSLLLLATAQWGQVPAVMAIRHFDMGMPLHHVDDPTPFLIAVLLGIPLLYAWSCYFKSALEISDHGIRQRCLYGDILLPWSQIADLKSNGYWLTVAGTKCTLRIGIGLGDLEKFKATVTERSPQLCARQTNGAIE